MMTCWYDDLFLDNNHRFLVVRTNSDCFSLFGSGTIKKIVLENLFQVEEQIDANQQ
jgi:hypothetical protein